MLESVCSLTSAALKKPLCWGTCPSLRLKRFTHMCYLTLTHLHPLLCYLLYYAYTHWGFYQAKVFFTGDRLVKKRPLDATHSKQGFLTLGSRLPWTKLQYQLGKIPKSFWKGDIGFFLTFATGLGSLHLLCLLFNYISPSAEKFWNANPNECGIGPNPSQHSTKTNFWKWMSRSKIPKLRGHLIQNLKEKHSVYWGKSNKFCAIWQASHS